MRVDTFLDNPFISSLHATIRWNGEKWVLFDHSRNGTYWNGNRLDFGSSREIKQGDFIAFQAQAGHVWEMESAAPPRPLLISQNLGKTPIALLKHNYFPNKRNPQVKIHHLDGARWQWEKAGKKRIITHNDLVFLDGEKWRLYLPYIVKETLPLYRSIPLSSSDFIFHFDVSRNEEHCMLYVEATGQKWDLGERVHHYLLVTLARKRIEDQHLGLDIESQGWLDVSLACMMLRLDLSHLNIQIFRAKQQFKKSFPRQGFDHSLIERRRGEIRLGSYRFTIKSGGSKIEYDLNAPVEATG